MTPNLGAYDEHPEAAAELLNCVRYYGPAKGTEFNRRVLMAIADIVDNPDAWPAVHYWRGSPPLRSRRISGFAERVVYFTSSNGRPVIIAYAHPKRREGYRLDQ